MRVLIRAFKNIFRSPARGLLVVLVLMLSMAVFLTMTQATLGISKQTQNLGSKVGILIEVRAAGATGMGVGVDALSANFFDKAENISNITTIEKYLYQRMIDRSKPASISIVIGVEPGDTLRVASHGEVGDPVIVKGRNFTPEDTGKNVAIVGKVFASQNNVDVGSETVLKSEFVQLSDRPNPNVKVEDIQIKIIGIFESGFVFGDNQVFLPLDFAQKAFAQDGKATHVFVKVSSVDKVDQVEKDLKAAFGDEADIISGQETSRTFAKTLSTIQSNSILGAIISIIVAALVILFTMALVTQERIREIGVLKAIGASNADIAKQFVAESVVFAFIGASLGLLLFSLLGSTLASALLGSLAKGQYQMTFTGGENPLTILGISYGISPLMLLAAFLSTILLGIFGSLYSVLRSISLRPIDALRYE